MKLKCWYERSKTPELQLFPAKIEQLSTNPSFVKIHEAIGPKVASKLKELSLSTQYVEIYKPTTTCKYKAPVNYVNLMKIIGIYFVNSQLINRK